MEDDVTLDERCREVPTLVKSYELKPYKVELYDTENYFCRILQIKKSNKIVARIEGIGDYIYFEDDKAPFMQMNRDVKQLFLPVYRHTGGSTCCLSLTVFKLGENFQKLLEIDAGSFLYDFLDLNQDGKKEIIVRNSLIKVTQGNYIKFPSGHIVFELKSNKFEIASSLMFKKFPDKNKVERLKKSWRQEFKKKNWSVAPYGFTQDVTDMIISGHEKFALRLAQENWSGTIKQKAAFFEEYQESIKLFSNNFESFTKEYVRF
jgi:hypothetical protein